jgi:hypothetical protein
MKAWKWCMGTFWQLLPRGRKQMTNGHPVLDAPGQWKGVVGLSLCLPYPSSFISSSVTQPSLKFVKWSDIWEDADHLPLSQMTRLSVFPHMDLPCPGILCHILIHNSVHLFFA